jgi:hypothetical protein
LDHLLAELESFSTCDGGSCSSLHIDAAQIQVSGGEPWAVADRDGEALAGAVHISLLNLNDTEQILDAAIVWKLLASVGYLPAGAIEVVSLNQILDRKQSLPIRCSIILNLDCTHKWR